MNNPSSNIVWHQHFVTQQDRAKQKQQAPLHYLVYRVKWQWQIHIGQPVGVCTLSNGQALLSARWRQCAPSAQ